MLYDDGRGYRSGQSFQCLEGVNDLGKVQMCFHSSSTKSQADISLILFLAEKHIKYGLLHILV